MQQHMMHVVGIVRLVVLVCLACQRSRYVKVGTASGVTMRKVVTMSEGKSISYLATVSTTQRSRRDDGQ